jgi:hypothetical protein
MIDWEKKWLRTNFRNRMTKFEDFAITTGISGAAIDEMDVVRVEKPTGHHTDRNPAGLMAVPLSSRDRLLALLAVGGRADGTAFVEGDELNLKAIAPICGMALDNAQRETAALNIVAEVQNVMEGFSTKTLNLGQKLEILMGQAKAILKAKRITFFEGENVLEMFTIGGEPTVSKEIAQLATKEQKTVVKSGVDQGIPMLIGAIPLMETDSTVVGALEITCPSFDSVDDIALVESFLSMWAELVWQICDDGHNSEKIVKLSFI